MENEEEVKKTLDEVMDLVEKTEGSSVKIYQHLLDICEKEEVDEDAKFSFIVLFAQNMMQTILYEMLMEKYKKGSGFSFMDIHICISGLVKSCELMCLEAADLFQEEINNMQKP